MKLLWKFLTSIRLTLFLLGSGTFLIFFGTLDQVHDGIYLTQQRYFEHVFVLWSYPQQFPAYAFLKWVQLPLPGGYLLGPLLLLNLFCAHFRYYRVGWKKVGIACIHLGLVLLLLGQFVAQVGQTDYFLWLAEGESNNYVEAFHHDELVVIDKSSPETDRVISWPVDAFQHKPTTLRHLTLPFTLNIVGFVQNANIMPADQAPPGSPDFGFTHGIGAERNFTVLKMPPTYADGERNRATAVVDIATSKGVIGRWLLSNVFRQQTPMTIFTPAQEFEVNGKVYEIALRFQRKYLPGSIELLDFKHDRYPGTEIPFNYSSDIRLHDLKSNTQRDNLIYMNHPLRYAGLTFYQASFADQDTKSMFQVVRNPGRAIPYIASALMTIGLVFQFSFSLVLFISKRAKHKEGTSR